MELLAWGFTMLMFWGIAFIGQRNFKRAHTLNRNLKKDHLWYFTHLLIKVPSWMSFLCGNPIPDNEVEVSGMVSQLLAWFGVVLWVALILLGIPFEIRSKIYALGIMVLIFDPLISGIFIFLWKKIRNLG